VQSGKLELSLLEHSDIIYCCTVLPDKRDLCLISGSADKTLKIWNVRNGKCEVTLQIDFDNI
jgi:WD40 repeat protein